MYFYEVSIMEKEPSGLWVGGLEGCPGSTDQGGSFVIVMPQKTVKLLKFAVECGEFKTLDKLMVTVDYPKSKIMIIKFKWLVNSETTQ